MVWSHGRDSGPFGAKFDALAETARNRGLEVIAPDYCGLFDPAERVEVLRKHCRDLTRPPLLVGSSMGGLVSVLYAQEAEATGLFVLAPAVHLAGWPFEDRPLKTASVAVVHGWRDEVIPVDNAVRFARDHRAALHVVDDGHRLAESIGRLTAYLDEFLSDLAARA